MYVIIEGLQREQEKPDYTFARKHLKNNNNKSQSCSGITCFGQMKQRWICIKMMGKGKWCGDSKHTTSCAKHAGGSIMVWGCIATNGLTSIYWRWDCWQKQKDELTSFRQNVTKLKTRTAHHSTDGYRAWISSERSSCKLKFLVTKKKNKKAERPVNTQQLKFSDGESRQRVSTEESGDGHEFWTSGSSSKYSNYC